MDLPVKYLERKIREIQQQLVICEANDCDVDEVKNYLLQYKYAKKLLQGFGFKRQHIKSNDNYISNGKLTVNQVKYIRKFYNKDAGKYSEHSITGFAKKYGVHETSIINILTYRTWKQVA